MTREPQTFEVVDDTERAIANLPQYKYGPLFAALDEGKTVRLPFDDTDSGAIRATWYVAMKGSGKHVHVKRNGASYIAWACAEVHGK